MKRILITGKDSYIGTSFEKYMEQFNGEYEIDTIDMIGEDWKKTDFSKYDSVFHVAGIAHRKETIDNAQLYYKVNRNLAYAVARKSKREGVKQFIFLSSGTVYGMETGVITKDTPMNPKTHYGRSKAQAEDLIKELESDNFKVAILRPLMVYGKGCKGNFQSIIKIVKISPIFPRVHNKRSLIYIDNLSSFVKMTVDRELSGTFFPKNKEDVDIYDIVHEVSNALGKKVYMSYMLGAILYLFRNMFSVTRKAFMNMVYKEIDTFDYNYVVCDVNESINKSV